MLDKFRSRFPIPDKQWQKYVGYFSHVTVPAHTVLLKEGDISTKGYFIEKGVLRACFDHNGKDISFQFFFENQTVASIESFIKSTPSRLSIETIESCELWVVEKKNLQRMADEVNEIKEVRDLIISSLLERTFNYMEHFLSFIRDTPEQRYLKLIENTPQVVQRVPQHYIASYLGVSSVHLSRIKGKIAKKKS
jgi:CRP-like cAMP-binding protein